MAILTFVFIISILSTTLCFAGFAIVFLSTTINREDDAERVRREARHARSKLKRSGLLDPFTNKLTPPASSELQSTNDAISK